MFFCDIWLKSEGVLLRQKTSPKIAYFHRWELILDEKTKGYAYLINELFCILYKIHPVCKLCGVFNQACVEVAF